jgi:hypothetical protein
MGRAMFQRPRAQRCWVTITTAPASEMAAPMIFLSVFMRPWCRVCRRPWVGNLHARDRKSPSLWVPGRGLRELCYTCGFVRIFFGRCLARQAESHTGASKSQRREKQQVASASENLP